MSRRGRQLLQVAPFQGELTSSWLARMSDTCGLHIQDLVRAALADAQPAQVTGAPQPGREVFFNRPARAAVCHFTAMPDQRLGALLPSFAGGHELLDDGFERALAAWYTPRLPWVSACSRCDSSTARASASVMMYPGSDRHICRRHRRWLLAAPGRCPTIALAQLPEVVAAHAGHMALTRTVPQAPAMVAFGAAVVWSWQVQGWALEPVWARRISVLAGQLDCSSTVVAAHPLIPYPETVAVARLLGAPAWRRHLVSTAAVHGLRTARQELYEALARCTDRPWLADWLAAGTRLRHPAAPHPDPLEHWLACLLGTTAWDGGPALPLWDLPDSIRWPGHYGVRSSCLTEVRSREITDQARHLALTGGWHP
ncbi:hypothetical protein ACFQ7F_24895 [Streptomyces sp. NPDC056486]|uniref:hypothetical protein n=1 Tax=Streptomyces sp. NPDC056486 TaxID=3345835 RepID=UPI0036952DC9